MLEPTFWGFAEDLGGPAEVSKKLSVARRRREQVNSESPITRAGADCAIAKLELLRGDAKAAEQVARSAFELCRDELGLLDRNTTTARSLLSQALMQLDRLADAEVLEREASEAVARTSDERRAVATAMGNLAVLLARTDREQQAEALLERALEAFDGDPVGRSLTLVNLSVLLSDIGREVEADEILNEAVEVLEAELGADSPRVAISRLNQAIGRAQRGEALNAMAALDNCDKRLAKALGDAHPLAIFARGVRAMIDAGLGRDCGREEARSVLDALRATLGPDHHQTRHAEGLLNDVIEGTAPVEGDSDGDKLHKSLLRAERAIGRRDFKRAFSILDVLAAASCVPGGEPVELLVRRLRAKALAGAERTDDVRRELERARELAIKVADRAALADIEASLAVPDEGFAKALRAALQARIARVSESLSGAQPMPADPLQLRAELDSVAEEAEQASLWLTAAAARVVHGKLLLAARLRAPAEEQLGAAMSLAERSGSPELVAHIQALLGD